MCDFCATLAVGRLWSTVNIFVLMFTTGSTAIPDFGEAIAEFGVSQRGYATLIFRGHSYVKDRAFQETTNWRCALFRKHKCRARAITRRIHGQAMVKASNSYHTHGADDGDNMYL